MTDVAEAEDRVQARAYVGMGSNLGDRLATLRAAADALRRGFVPHTWLVGTSSIYETKPIGPSEDPFLNAAVAVRTTLAPRALLDGLHALEAEHGRQRTQRWAARTLDLDLLLFVPPGADRSLRIDRIGLRVPHPALHHRDFVLAPLTELTGPLPIYAGHTATTLLEALPPSRHTLVRRLDDPLLPPTV